MLSKQASASRKPNKQTLVPNNSIDILMKEIKLRDLRGLGGKLGDILQEATGVTYAYELQQFELSWLCSKVGDKSGKWVYDACRGVDNDPVVGQLSESTGSNSSNSLNNNDSMLNKSVLASKSFAPCVMNKQQLMPWITVLCTDVHQRLVYEDMKYNRRARSLHVYHRGPGSNSGSKATVDNNASNNNTNSNSNKRERVEIVSLARTCKLPSLDYRVPTLDVLVQCAVKLLESKIPCLYPCYGLGIGGTDIVTLNKPSNTLSVSCFIKTNNSVNTSTGDELVLVDSEGVNTDALTVGSNDTLNNSVNLVKNDQAHNHSYDIRDSFLSASTTRVLPSPNDLIPTATSHQDPIPTSPSVPLIPFPKMQSSPSLYHETTSNSPMNSPAAPSLTDYEIAMRLQESYNTEAVVASKFDHYFQKQKNNSNSVSSNSVSSCNGTRKKAKVESEHSSSGSSSSSISRYFHT